jgi:hypothetical protein
VIPGIASVVKKLRKSAPDPSIQQLLDQLVSDTREECKKLGDETRAIEKSLLYLKVDPKKTLSDIGKDMDWYSFRAKYRLRRHEKALRNIEQSLSTSVSDFTALLICAGKVNALSGAAAVSQAVRKDLDGLIERPIEEILAIYRKTIDRYVDDLS